ncbi:MAG: hypothetical protein ABN482_03420 [Corticimicrobacter sp.]
MQQFQAAVQVLDDAHRLVGQAALLAGGMNLNDLLLELAGQRLG